MTGENLSGAYAYVAHLQRQHRQLDQQLLKIQQQIADEARGSEDAISSELVLLLQRHLQDIRAHFDEEESGCCFEEAASRVPHLGPDVAALFAEHPARLQSFVELVARARNRSLTLRQLQRDFATHAQAMREHEAAESRLLQLAFGSEAADQADDRA
jgi:hypothetical protein